MTARRCPRACWPARPRPARSRCARRAGTPSTASSSSSASGRRGSIPARRGAARPGTPAALRRAGRRHRRGAAAAPRPARARQRPRAAHARRRPRAARRPAPGVRLAVVGAGLVGLEVAATARALGAAVIVIEAAPAPLAAVLGTRSALADRAASGGWRRGHHRAWRSGRARRRCARRALVLARRAPRRLRRGARRRRHAPGARSWLAGCGLPPGPVATDAAGRTARAACLRGRRRARSRALGDGGSPGGHRRGDDPRRPRPGGAAGGLLERPARRAPAVRGHRCRPRPRGGRGRPDSPATRAPSSTAAAGSSAGCCSAVPASCPPCGGVWNGPPTPNPNGAQHDPRPHHRPLACSAHGDCAVVAPEVFRVDDAAVVVGSGAPDIVMAAAEACPAVAISRRRRGDGPPALPVTPSAP